MILNRMHRLAMTGSGILNGKYFGRQNSGIVKFVEERSRTCIFINYFLQKASESIEMKLT
jgi:hypothetical protein